MRVLTVRQPWAWAIVHGGKDVENRVRSLGPYRGPIAIHVSQRPVPPGEPWSIVAQAGMDTDRYDGDVLQLGHVIGVVDLVDEHPGHNTDPDRHRAIRSCFQPGMPYGPCSPWAMPDHHHLMLANPRPLPRPIPATGRLGLWRPDDALLAAITEQLRPGEQVAP